MIKNRKLILLVLLGSLSWSLTMVKSGLPTRWGIGFWGPNGHDGIWHLALIESIKHGFPIQNPLASGSFVTNYHWGFDFLVAIVSRITSLSSSFLYFQAAPPILALSIGLLTYLLVRDWTKSRPVALWAVFFTYFGGSFGWIITSLRSGEFGGESLFWSQQAISTLINPPYALSLVLLLLGFLLVIRKPNPQIKDLFLQVIVFSPLFIIKSYAALIALVGLFAFGAFSWLKSGVRLGLIRAFLVFVATSSVVLLTSPGASSLIQLEPLWFTHTMVEAADRFYLPKLFLARQAYNSYHMYHRLIPLELLLVAIFLIGNLGTRLVALIYLKNIKNTSAFGCAVAAMASSAIILPLLFTQKGTTWNTIQFFYYGQVFFGWFAAIALVKSNKSWLSLAIIALTLPTSISTLWYNYIPPRPPAVLTYDENSALGFLKTQPYGTVLTYPYQKSPTPLPPPIPLYQYESTAYIPAYSGMPSYVADTVNLSILGYPWEPRYKEAQNFFAATDYFSPVQFLRDNNISYIYLVANQKLPAPENLLGIDRIFENSVARLYKVRK
jgi:hypothetical protein